MEENSANNTALEEMPPTPPLWVRAAWGVGFVLFSLIFLTGADVWSDRLFDLLVGWGLVVEPRGAGGLVLMPILFGVIITVIDGRAYRATARPVAEGVLWGGALFLIVPAMMVLLQLAAPNVAATDDAEWVLIAPLLLLAIWFYIYYRRLERDVVRFKAELMRKAHNRNARNSAPGHENDGEANP